MILISEWVKYDRVIWDFKKCLNLIPLTYWYLYQWSLSAVSTVVTYKKMSLISHKEVLLWTYQTYFSSFKRPRFVACLGTAPTPSPLTWSSRLFRCWEKRRSSTQASLTRPHTATTRAPWIAASPRSWPRWGSRPSNPTRELRWELMDNSRFENCHFDQLSFWPIVILTKSHFDQLSFWPKVILTNCHFDQMSFWPIVILTKCHVDQMSDCILIELWNSVGASNWKRRFGATHFDVLFLRNFLL